MPQDAALAAGLPGSIQGWQPTTFLERGVAAPFTTPQLLGARLRPTARGGLELVVPDVAGPGSVGILAWQRVGVLCSPTVFDRKLAARLAAAPALTPAAMRAAACAEAVAGLAGPEAQEAALRAQEADAAERARAVAALPQGEPGSNAAAALAELAGLLAPVGLGPAAETARLPRTLAAVAALEAQIIDRQRAGAGAAEAELVAAAAGQVVQAAGQALAAARLLAADPRALLRRWLAGPEALALELGRAEWLLDGWAWLCRLAAAAEDRPGGAAALLAELALLTPALPREAGGGAAARRRLELPGAIRGLLRGADWRSGVTAQDLVARNERLLAGVLAGPETPP